MGTAALRVIAEHDTVNDQTLEPDGAATFETTAQGIIELCELGDDQEPGGG